MGDVWRVTRTWYVEADRASTALERTRGWPHSETDVLAVPTPRPGIPVIREGDQPLYKHYRPDVTAEES